MSKSKLAFVAAAAVMTAGTATLAGDRVPADAMPPAALIYQLVADGYDVRSLEFERGQYRLWARAADGRLVSLTADSTTGAVSSSAAEDGKAAGKAAPAVPTSAGDAIALAALEGHYDVSELHFRDGAYRIDARDAAGIPARITVDASNGKVMTLSHVAH